MNLIPNTTCRRCHRQYAAFRGRCPYCGTKKVREVRSAVPETDSALPGTEAARNAAEAVNWQMLIGGGLLLAVIVATIVLVSVNVSRANDDRQIRDQLEGELEMTPIPLPTASPTPSPTPPPQITDLECRWGQDGVYDYIEMGGFRMPVGATIDLCAIWYPNTVVATPEWSVEDEDVISISVDGFRCDAKAVGEVGQSTTLHLKVNELEGSFTITIAETW